MGEFGDKFRKAREKKNFSLDDVSQVTKIGVRMLQAIEEEHFDRLPGGVFNKGFIRTYAKHLGMNDDAAVASYLACVRGVQVTANQPTVNQTADLASSGSTRGAAHRKSPAASNKKLKKQPAAAQPTTAVEELPDLQLPRSEHVRPPKREGLRGSQSRVPWRIVALAGLVLFALFVWNRHSRRVHAHSASPATSGGIASTLTPISASDSAATSYHTAGTRTDSAMQSRASEPASAVHAIAPEAGPNTPQAEAINSGAAPLTSSPQKPAAPLTLTIRATENSWISVRADGQEVTAETLIAPAHTSVRAAREIVVKTGNAAGINFVWNGQEIPAQSAEAEVKTFIFDATGLRTPPVLQPATQNP